MQIFVPVFLLHFLLLFRKMQATLIVINGPTAVGKTKLAIDLARALNTEIISTDSRQFYQEMNIGTAKPNEEELAQVKHHFISNCSIHDYYSAGDFERESLAKATELFGSGKDYVIAIGGSGLYIKALCEGLDEMPLANLALRKELINHFETSGINYLQTELKKLNPEKFSTIDQKNPQRLMRAIELSIQGEVIQKPKSRPFRVLKIGLELPREILYGRINSRVNKMMEDGLLKEVKSLVQFEELNALKTVGYKELFAHLRGELDLPKSVDLIKQHSRNYAKRQMTWFKADSEIAWFSPENQLSIFEFIRQF